MITHDEIMHRLDDLANNEAVIDMLDKIAWIVAGVLFIGIIALGIVGHATGAL